MKFVMCDMALYQMNHILDLIVLVLKIQINLIHSHLGRHRALHISELFPLQHYLKLSQASV